MTIEVKISGVNGGAGLPVLNFQDSFQRPDEPFYLGDDWYSIVIGTSNETGLALAAQINVNGAGAQFGSGSGANNNQLAALFIPAIINIPFVRKYSQTLGLFAQVKVVSFSAGIDCLAGLSLLCEPNDSEGYFWIIDSSTGLVTLFRNIHTAPVALSTPCTLLFNDVLRAELTIDPVTTFVTLKTFQNGTLVDTTVDNSVSRVTRPGAYGMNLAEVFTGIILFQNFSGGVL